ncbi:MarR family winged helix-turn-helix transcriptional regulator [Zunongwangia profunda]|jgi:DNA-binding MarR family transcriptional regulator|uniref:MarR family winged helix-turn-helix transcriptional regulator n=1 Tax=Zunongwangia profunda TaxID=398743 RepID=UPI001D193FC6|nr:MarR family transcriptional regulator [Zunongwangia profunda]MCC4230290.1 MarR family transcriptional regulator [Zunongwangia profunda]|tara:strand:+ start:433 stop:873 length:441 start_codon:yes stop_codon:yes gene_type:complete
MTAKSTLTLNEQLCFPVYGSTRIISRLYQPVLAKLQLSYPEYLVMLTLWENSEVNIGQIRRQLYLNKESLMPILNSLQQKDFISIKEQTPDALETKIHITKTGKALKTRAKRIPFSLSRVLNTPVEELGSMQLLIKNFLNRFEKKK